MTVADFDALRLVKLEKRPDDPTRKWYAADPDRMYPAMLVYLQEAQDTDLGEIPQPVQQYVMAVQTADFPKRAWGDALGSSDGLRDDRRYHRGALLELSRLAFTALLRAQVDEPIGLHILPADQWRL